VTQTCTIKHSHTSDQCRPIEHHFPVYLWATFIDFFPEVDECDIAECVDADLTVGERASSSSNSKYLIEVFPSILNSLGTTICEVRALKIIVLKKNKICFNFNSSSYYLFGRLKLQLFSKFSSKVSQKSLFMTCLAHLY